MTKRPRVLATLEGYAVEGGFDRPHEPATCFAPTIALGRHAGPGDAEGLWRDYERVIDLVPSLGLDGVRLTIEWARVEPRRGVHDDDALARYERVIGHARSLGLDVTIALFGDVWPSWTGMEAWLLPWVVPYATQYATRVVGRLGEAATGVVVFTDAEKLVTRGYLDETAPPWRRGAVADATSVRQQVRHVVGLLSADATVGPRLVETTRTIELDHTIEEITDQRRRASACDELYVRSLVKGRGPTSAPGGLVGQDAGVWSTSASKALLDVLR